MIQLLVLTFVLVSCSALTQEAAGAEDVKALLDDAYGSYRGQEYEKVIAVANRVIKLDPGSGDAYILRAVAQLRLGREPKSLLPDLNEGIKKSPEHPWGYGYRGCVMFSLGKTEEALADLSTAFRLDPTDAVIVYKRGLAHLHAARKFDRAIADFTKAIELAPEFAEAWGARAEAHLLTSNLSKALVDIEKAIGWIPRNPEYLLIRAQVFFLTNDLERAVADASKAIEINPKSAVAHFIRARASAAPFCETGRSSPRRVDLAPALRDFDTAIRLNPKKSEYFIERAVLRTRLQDFADALDDLEKAQALEPQRIGMLTTRSYINVQRECYAEALADANQAIALKPDLPDGYWSRAWVYGKQKEHERTIEEYSKVIAICGQPGMSRRMLIDAYRMRGLAHKARNDHILALADLNETLRLNPDDALAYRERGAILYEKEEFDNAIADFSSSISRWPTEPLAYEWRATAYREIGDEQKAAADSKRAKELRASGQ